MAAGLLETCCSQYHCSSFALYETLLLFFCLFSMAIGVGKGAIPYLSMAQLPTSANCTQSNGRSSVKYKQALILKQKQPWLRYLKSREEGAAYSGYCSSTCFKL